MGQTSHEQSMDDLFPRRALEQTCFHALSLMDQNREYLQMHLTEADEATRQSLADLEREAARLNRALSEMMELLTPEHERPVPRWFDLCGVLRQLDGMEQELLLSRGVLLTVEPLPERCLVRGDVQQAEVVCAHLLSNALRAVEPSRGRIGLSLQRQDDLWQLRVEDNGCGLPEGERWMENRRRFLGGAGAGLCVCRAICAHYGWSFVLRSRPGGGAEAVVTLPAMPEQSADCAAELRSPEFEPFSRLRWLLGRELCLLPRR